MSQNQLQNNQIQGTNQNTDTFGASIPQGTQQAEVRSDTREQQIDVPMMEESQPFRHAILDTLESNAGFSASNMLAGGRQPPTDQNINNRGINSSLLQPPREYQMQQQTNQNGLAPYLQHMSLASVQAPILSTKPESIKVILNCFNQRELIRDVPLQFSGEKLLLLPILNHIKYLGKPISGQSISYFSEEDEMDVFVGIEGTNITDQKIAIEEITCNGKLKLTLNVKTPQDASPAPPKNLNGAVIQHNQEQETSRPQNPEESQSLVAISVPKLTTPSQLQTGVDQVTEPMQRARATKAEMQQKQGHNASENVNNNFQSRELLDQRMKEEKKDPTPGNKNFKEERHDDSGLEDQDSLYEDCSDQDDSRNVSGNKKKDLNRPKHGGVLNGRDKKSVNAQQAIAQATQKKATIKSGPVSDADMQKKRTKERTITEIIEKVSTWRKLYNGVMIPNKDTGEVQLQRWSLEDAAAKVKVSKKSLDDYLLQLRFGKKFGFDFEQHRESKVGVLRSFVKGEKDQLKRQNNGQKISSKSPLREE